MAKQNINEQWNNANDQWHKDYWNIVMHGYSKENISIIIWLIFLLAMLDEMQTCNKTSLCLPHVIPVKIKATLVNYIY
jgi:hypothetical protein